MELRGTVIISRLPPPRAMLKTWLPVRFSALFMHVTALVAAPLPAKLETDRDLFSSRFYCPSLPTLRPRMSSLASPSCNQDYGHFPPALLITKTGPSPFGFAVMSLGSILLSSFAIQIPGDLCLEITLRVSFPGLTVSKDQGTTSTSTSTAHPTPTLVSVPTNRFRAVDVGILLRLLQQAFP
ncbi:uncharacterized protein EKO05_0004974 [Ascochyta rabiei]|uniref:Uncharacterized protein n=1 Tax=Didymella rabiei TaxID=5454 RepID=A0A163KKJ9_DIDRA|nr:uncharacterized protein EKO05_0004974 [Ascochyta rabiei]KZM27062.1 hypothetical protein ST47_g1833 [Ascochyta rabiei]UPX14494.1 hypothetical protein EKO05_0004974 [Ascochyta rabiei]